MYSQRYQEGAVCAGVFGGESEKGGLVGTRVVSLERSTGTRIQRVGARRFLGVCQAGVGPE